MAKIKKNLSDAEMFANYKEETTFETAAYTDEMAAPARTAAKPAARTDLASSMVTPELQEKLGKALLELKLELYKQGVVDYDLKISREANKIILTAAPAKLRKAKN